MQTQSLIRQLSGNYVFSPYAYLANYLKDGDLDNYFIEELESYIKTNNPYCINNTKGLATVEKREFDTTILAMNSARINYFLSTNLNDISVKQDLISQIDQLCFKEKIQYVTTRFSMKEINTIQLLESNGFITTDNLITFSLDTKDIKNLQYLEKDYDIDILDKNNPEHVDKIKEISKISFINDRFHNDPLISNEIANQIYYEWMENSCKNDHETIVTALNKNDNPLGFVICQTSNILNLKIGTIVLIAVDNKQRKRNIGYNMLIKSLKRFKDSNIDVVQVGTQLSNIPAQRLYLKMGFKPVSTTTTLRKYYELKGI